MSRNKLKLNPDKTEFLLIGNERQRSKYLSMFPVELLGVETYPAKSLAILEWSSTFAHIISNLFMCLPHPGSMAYSTLPHDLALMGDFNLRIDSSSSDDRQLSGILDSFDLHQYVDFPTHIHGHSLDLMICSPGCNVLSVSASDVISNHFSVVANSQIPSSHSWTIPQTIKYQKLQSINMEVFKADIRKQMQLNWLYNMTVSSTLSSIFMPHWLPKWSL